MDGRKLNSAACVTQVSNVLTCKYLEGFIMSNDIYNAKNLFESTSESNKEFNAVLPSFVDYPFKEGSSKVDYLAETINIISCDKITFYITTSVKFHDKTHKLFNIAMLVDYKSILEPFADNIVEHPSQMTGYGLVSSSHVIHHMDSFLQWFRSYKRNVWGVTSLSGVYLKGNPRREEHALKNSKYPLPRSQDIHSKYLKYMEYPGDETFDYEELIYIRFHLVLSMFIECLNGSDIPITINYMGALGMLKRYLLTHQFNPSTKTLLDKVKPSVLGNFITDVLDEASRPCFIDAMKL